MGGSTRRRNARHGASAAFTLIELLVVIAIIMILAAMALPVLMRAARQARAASCISNIKQLAVSFRSYANNNDGRLPGTQGSCQPNGQPTWLFHKDPDQDSQLATVWPDCPTKGQLFPHSRDPDLVRCPADRDGNGKVSYSVPQNIAFRLMDNVENSTKAVLMVEEHPQYHIAGIYEGTLVGAGGLQRREGGFGCSDRMARRHGTLRTPTGHFDASAGLIEWPGGFTATELEVKPWGFSCGWPKTTQ